MRLSLARFWRAFGISGRGGKVDNNNNNNNSGGGCVRHLQTRLDPPPQKKKEVLKLSYEPSFP